MEWKFWLKTHQKVNGSGQKRQIEQFFNTIEPIIFIFLSFVKFFDAKYASFVGLWNIRSFLQFRNTNEVLIQLTFVTKRKPSSNWPV